MTKILLSCVWWLRFTGFLTTTDIGGSRTRGPKIRKTCINIVQDLRLFVCILMAIVILVPQIAYLFLRTSDVLEVAQTSYAIIAILGRAMQSLIFAYNRKAVNQLLADVQKFVNTKDSQIDGNSSFKKAEVKLSSYCKVFERLLLVSLGVYVAVPVILEFQALRTGTTTVAHPDVGLFNDLHFFNTSTSPSREICYITMAFGHFLVSVLFITIDSLFCGLCLYIVAMYKDLQQSLRSIDEKSNVLLLKNSNANDDHQRSLVDCIEFHLKIISFTEAINAIYSNVIFLQYAISLLAMCGNIFVVILVDRSELFRASVTIPGFVAGLFIYCWFGQLVHNETNRLQDTLYNLRWYDYGLNEQKIIKLMILRAQKPCGLAAFNYFDCDLPTFFNIMTNVYSLVSFLQGVF